MNTDNIQDDDIQVGQDDDGEWYAVFADNLYKKRDLIGYGVNEQEAVENLFVALTYANIDDYSIS